MAKTTKSTKNTPAAPTEAVVADNLTSVAPVEIVPPPAAVVEEKAKKTKKTKKTATTEDVASVPTVDAPSSMEEKPVASVEAVESSEEAVVVSQDAQEEPVKLSQEDVILAQLNAFNGQIANITGLAQQLRVQYAALKKNVSKELKTYYKSSRKPKKLKNRQPSGFVCPTPISDELAGFLGKPSGTLMARTEVSKEINKYIRSNELQDKANGRIIHADTKLTSLLKLKETDKLSYFNLQKFLKHHFIKDADVSATAPAPVSMVEAAV